MGKTGLKRTNRHAHLTQEWDGLQIDRAIYTDGVREFIKINGFVCDLWKDFGWKTFKAGWKIDFIW